MVADPVELSNQESTCCKEYEGCSMQKLSPHFVWGDSDDSEEDREPG